MIKITSFYPFQNFLRVTQEFNEDKATVKVKSLTYERDYEIDYKDLKEISDKFHTSEDQIGFGIGFLALITFTLILFFKNIYAYSVLLRTVQVLYICGFIVFITGFKKNWQIYFTDKNGNTLTHVKQNTKNAELISKATELITSRVGSIQEITATDPFPEEKPIFEIIEYDVFEFEKSIEKFYEDNLITHYQTLFKESAYSTAYSRFSGKVFRGKVSAIPWFSYFCNLMYAVFILMGLDLAFNLRTRIDFLIIFRILLVLFIVCWLLSFLKREVIGLYDHDENIAFGTYVNQKNKAKTEEVIQFIQSKIPTKEKVQILKD